jgi:hypothetical protein
LSQLLGRGLHRLLWTQLPSGETTKPFATTTAPSEVLFESTQMTVLQTALAAHDVHHHVLAERAAQSVRGRELEGVGACTAFAPDPQTRMGLRSAARIGKLRVRVRRGGDPASHH